MNGHVLRTLNGHKGNITSASLSPGRREVLSGSEEGYLKLWDSETGQELRTFSGHKSAVHSVAFAPDGKTIVSGSADYPSSSGIARLGRSCIPLVAIRAPFTV